MISWFIQKLQIIDESNRIVHLLFKFVSPITVIISPSKTGLATCSLRFCILQFRIPIHYYLQWKLWTSGELERITQIPNAQNGAWQSELDKYVFVSSYISRVVVFPWNCVQYSSFTNRKSAYNSLKVAEKEHKFHSDWNRIFASKHLHAYTIHANISLFIKRIQ